MRSTRAASVALLGIAALGLSAPVAMAQSDITSFGFSATPGTVLPGGTLKVTSDCPRTTTVSSGIFDRTTIPAKGSATVVVDTDAKVGAQYQLTFACAGQSGHLSVTIGSPATPSPASTPSPVVTPSGAVSGGLGGGTGRLDGSEALAGGALVALALGGGVYVARRRRAGGHA
jgi:hypothetical protein